MIIDPEVILEKISDFINEKIEEQEKDGAVLGLSGGVDSTVAAYILVRAIKNTEKIHSMHLKKQGIYKPWIMHIVPYSTLVNKIILLSNKLASPILYSKTPFDVTLNRMNPKEMKFGFVAGIARTIEDGFNARHILRRRILEEYAEENNLLLVGAANKSESFVGWFVKDGVDDLPVELLLGLYKNQVRQLGQYMGVPSFVLGEAPSPDMFKGIGDEECIGHKYEIIDKVAYIFENDLGFDAALEEGISRKEYDHILHLHELSSWKRETAHEYPEI
jgi:NAD+ synthase